MRLLAGLPRAAGNPWVFPGRGRGRHLRSIDDAWKIVRGRAALDDVRLHDLRHSYASRALALGETLPMIGRLLGHSQMETTARYAHLARDTIRDSAARIADSIADDIFQGSSVQGIFRPDEVAAVRPPPTPPAGGRGEDAPRPPESPLPPGRRGLG